MSDGVRHPVTVLITRRVRPGRERAFEDVTDRLLEAARQFPGHLGGSVVRPEGPGGSLYQTIFAFDEQSNLDAWTQSRQRRDLLDRLESLCEGETATRVLSGLETWFALPTSPTRLPPPRWKMALVTWSGIFPLVLVLSQTISPLLAPFGVIATVFVVTGLVTVAMTWGVMPVLVRLLARWLYPDL